jgi:hypothetical protein
MKLLLVLIVLEQENNCDFISEPSYCCCTCTRTGLQKPQGRHYSTIWLLAFIYFDSSPVKLLFGACKGYCSVVDGGRDFWCLLGIE